MLMCLDFGALVVRPSSGPFNDYLYRYWRAPTQRQPEAATREALREMRFVCECVEAVRANDEVSCATA